VHRALTRTLPCVRASRCQRSRADNRLSRSAAVVARGPHHPATLRRARRSRQRLVRDATRCRARLGQRFDLPLPLWLWLGGAAASIIVTFAVIAFFVRERRFSAEYPR